MPSAGSGSSGGTSSAGKLTSHASFGNPYKQRFSFSEMSLNSHTIQTSVYQLAQKVTTWNTLRKQNSTTQSRLNRLYFLINREIMCIELISCSSLTKSFRAMENSMMHICLETGEPLCGCVNQATKHEVKRRIRRKITAPKAKTR